MHIVAAGVHTAVLRAKGQVGLLGDAQRIHIRTQQDAGPGIRTGDFRSDASCELLRLVPHFAQPAGNVFPGARQVGAGLRGGVESASVADHRLAERFGLRKNFLC